MRVSENINVTIQRVGAEPVIVSAPVDSTVAQVLTIAGINLQQSEQVYFNGGEVNAATSVVDNGDAIQIVQNKKGGH